MAPPDWVSKSAANCQIGKKVLQYRLANSISSMLASALTKVLSLAVASFGNSSVSPLCTFLNRILDACASGLMVEDVATEILHEASECPETEIDEAIEVFLPLVARLLRGRLSNANLAGIVEAYSDSSAIRSDVFDKFAPLSPSRPAYAFFPTASEGVRVLPLEIRLQIYRENLLGKNVKAACYIRGRSSDIPGPRLRQRYEFDVNILRVNKAVYNEAKPVLYKENIFVSVSVRSQDTRLGDMFRDIAVPYVSNKRGVVESFQEHALQFYMEGFVKGAQRFLLILGDDLETFLLGCRIDNHSMTSELTVITSPQDCATPVRFHKLGYSSLDYGTIDITFRPRRTYGSLQDLQVRRLLDQIFKVVGTRTVSIIGINQFLARQTSDAMVVRVAWGCALGWDLLEVAQKVKALCDNVVTANVARRRWSTLAQVYYGMLQDILRDSMVVAQLPNDMFTYDAQQCCDWIDALRHILCSVTVACSWSYLHEEALYFAGYHIDAATRLMRKTSHVPLEIYAVKRVVEAMVVLEEARKTGAKRFGYFDAASCLLMAIEALEKAGLPVPPSLRVDFEKVRKFTFTRRSVNHFDTFASILNSVGTYRALDTPLNPVKPSSIVGWQSTAHTLTEADLTSMGVTQHDVPTPSPASTNMPICTIPRHI